MRKENKSALFLMVLLLLVAITSVYVTSTYAKYTSEIKGNNGTAQVAKWAFEGDNPKKTLTIQLDKTYNASTLVNGRIAPGTQGSFGVALVNTNSEVGVDFTVKLNSITDKPTNLKFYKDSSFSTELKPGEGEITGQLAATDSIGVTVPIYWKWAYETATITENDPKDTSDGKAAKELTIGVDITGVQITPSTTAITSHIN
ncbi:MAG: hypothetical protein K6D97_00660 [Clostridia bacterium]|nr:hypothetical protein [Clostridia bacterium]